MADSVLFEPFWVDRPDAAWLARAMRLLGLYVVAGIAYVGVGLVEPAVLLHWLLALPFLLVIVCLLPELVRRLR